MSRPEAADGLNDAQTMALDFSRDLIVSAGAGAGKTRVLSLRFLALIEEGHARVHEIVAFTFTEAAAAEMRTRCLEMLQTRRNELPDGEARTRIETALRDFSRNRITTIHGFCFGLVSDHAFEAGLEPNAPVLDERAQSRLARSVVDNVLRNPPNDAIHDDIVMLGQETKLRDLTSVLMRLINQRQIAEGSFARLVESVETSLDAEIEKRREAYESGVIATAQPLFDEVLAWPEIAGVKADDKLLVCINDIRASVRQQDVNALMQLVLSAKGEALKVPKGAAKSKWPSVEYNEEWQARRHAFAQRVQEILGPWFGYEFDSAFERRCALVGASLGRVFNAVLTAYHFERNSAFDFVQMESETLRILRDDQLANEISRDIHYLLIDEFQDTNPVQAEIFQRLIDHGPKRAGRVFMVGDAKQSIYYFRGSDVTVFREAQTETPARNATNGFANRPAQLAWGMKPTDDVTDGCLNMSDNYRSKSALLAVVNRVFENVFRVDDPQAYDPEPQAMNAKRDDAGSDAEQRVEIFAYPSNKSWTNDAQCHEMAGRVKALMADNPDLTFNDFAILLRTRARLADLQRIFGTHGIPLVSIGQAGLWSTEEGRDCLNLLRVLANPRNDIALLGLLRSSWFAISDAQLVGLKHRYGPLFERIRDDLPDVVAKIQELRDLGHTLSVSRLLARALADFAAYYAVSGGAFAAQRRANLDQVLDVVREIEQERPTLGALVREIDEAEDVAEDNDSERQGEPDSDVEGVRVMTIHASKGMEFPVVMLPFMGANGGGNSRGIVRDLPSSSDHAPGLTLRVEDNASGDHKSRSDLWTKMIANERNPRETAEKRRLLYVAMTRAKDRLIMLGKTTKTLDGAGWMDEVLVSLGATGDDKTIKDAPQIALTWPDEQQTPRAGSYKNEREECARVLETGVVNLAQGIDLSLLASVEVPGETVYLDSETVELGIRVHRRLERHFNAHEPLDIGAVDLTDPVAAHASRALKAIGERKASRRDLAEFALMKTSGEVGRIDLLRVMGEGEFEIIDFKTDPDDSRMDAHREQLAEYRASLAEYLSRRGVSNPTIRTLVCFTTRDTNTLIEIE